MMMTSNILRSSLEHLGHRLGLQQLGGVRRDRAAGQHRRGSAPSTPGSRPRAPIWPTRTVVRPTAVSSRRLSATFGRRRSASMSSTPLAGLGQRDRQVRRRWWSCPRSGTELVTTKTLLSSVDVHELQVRAQHAERLHPRRVELEVGDQRLLHRAGIEGDVAHDRGAGGLRDVLVGLHAGVEHLAEHGERRARAAARGWRRGRGCARAVVRRASPAARPRRRSVALIGAFALPGGVSSSATKSVSSSATACASCCACWGLGSVTVISRITVSGTTVALIFSASSLGLHVEPELVDDAAREFLTAREVGVRRHALSGEQAALVGLAAVALRRRDEQSRARGVLRCRLEGDERGYRDRGDDATEDEHPAAARDPQVVTKFHPTPQFRS